MHFEVHSENGELIKWKSLRPTLSTINYHTENNLFVSLATCYGAFLFSAADMLERVPFLGLIGPAHEVNIGDVQKDWGTYFDILLNSKDFYDAIISLNKSNDRVPYKFFSAEQIWEMYCNAYLEMFASRKDQRAKLLSLHRNSKNFPGLQNLSHAERDAIFKIYISNQKLIMDGFKEYFLMRTDKQPF